ncbi:hypothetical protein M2152_001889 [Microbacteriaceae bacterium SG_E_30_P1]|uniref:Uncharacterized protein n=1 Tax=Antiquaquibacter oligotrophicus TaxID=2880260 RepID=A0ABT6KRI5_9MICO|nr:hypothetical protein [Antiquaquibacter oligotrophicus]MDH6181707.1 hypothetical protein [Antiquaquibacter oligotrophicus]UDF12610.1 hypothetical protein LH407_10655 [Antiquaquibacter oligotrophicus]
MMVAVWTVGLLALWSLAIRRTSAPAAAGFAVIGLLGVELVILLVSPHLGVPLPWLEAAVWAAVVLVAIVTAARAGVTAPSRRALALTLAAASGGLLVIATAVLAQVLPGALHIAWAMNSDSVNVIVFSREILEAGGIVPSGTGSPTPLPFGMVASAMAPGRNDVSDAGLAGHDVAALAGLWVFMLAVCCLLAGAIVARSATRLRTPVAAIVTVIASLLGTTWFVLGVQFQYGFVTTSFALALLLSVWLVYLDSPRHPVASLAALIVAAAALLAVWSPLVVVVAPLGVLIAVRSRREILRAGWRRMLAPIAAIALAVGYLAAVSIPQYLAASAFLAADGGFPTIGPATIVSAVGLVGVLAALSARFAGERRVLSGVLAMVIGFALGLGFLLAQRVGFETTWGYYPAKFGWTVSIVFLVIALGAAASLLEHLAARRTEIIASVFGTVLLAGLVWSPGEPQDPISQLPLVEIVGGNAFGLTNEQADTVLSLSGRENGQDVLWRTPYDSWGNRWLLQLDVDEFHTNPVKAYAYLPSLSAGDVCAVIDLLGTDVTVHTDDPNAEADLDAVCPGAATVVMGR